jgi:hypothetical protein
MRQNERRAQNRPTILPGAVRRVPSPFAPRALCRSIHISAKFSPSALTPSLSLSLPRAVSRGGEGEIVLDVYSAMFSPHAPHTYGYLCMLLLFVGLGTLLRGTTKMARRCMSNGRTYRRPTWSPSSTSRGSQTPAAARQQGRNRGVGAGALERAGCNATRAPGGYCQGATVQQRLCKPRLPALCGTVFCGGVGGAAAGRGCARAAAPSATISGARFVVDADFAKQGSFALSPIFRLGRSGAAAPSGGPAAAARPRRGLGAIMLQTSTVAASTPGAGKNT